MKEALEHIWLFRYLSSTFKTFKFFGKVCQSLIQLVYLKSDVFLHLYIVAC